MGHEHWLVIDDLCSAAAHNYRLHWLLSHAPYRWLQSAPATVAADTRIHRLSLETPHGDYQVQFAARAGARHRQNNNPFELHEACENSPVGWHCPRYGVRRPALSVSTVATTARVQFFTLFGPPPAELYVPGHADPSVRVRLPTGEANIRLCPSILKRSTSAPPTAWDKRPMIQSLKWRASSESVDESRPRQVKSSERIAS